MWRGNFFMSNVEFTARVRFVVQVEQAQVLQVGKALSASAQV